MYKTNMDMIIIAVEINHFMYTLNTFNTYFIVCRILTNLQTKTNTKKYLFSTN